MKKFLALLLGLCMLLSCTAMAEVAKTLPTAESITIDLDDYYGQKIEGYYNYDCIVNLGADGAEATEDDVVRTAKFYVPAGSVFNQPTVFVGVPNGVDTWEFLVESGWKDLADEKKLYIIMMEPKDGVWGDEADEIAYIGALNEDVSYRPFFCTFSSNFYGIAYGEAADLLQKHSVNNPKAWGSIAVVGASGMTTEQMAALEAAPSRVPGVTLAQAMTPVWVVAEEKTEAIENMLTFYKNANHAEAQADATADYADEVYQPMAGGTVDDHWCAKTIFSAGKWTEMVNKAFSDTVYTKLFEGTYRYPGNANGALRVPGEIFSRGFVKYEEVVEGGFYEDGSDKYLREWYVYYPESAQAKAANGEKVPLVFVFHGAGGSGNEIADRSGWATVAAERGCIIVMPTGSHVLSVRHVSNMYTNEYFRAMWNTGDATFERPSDLKFVAFLRDWMIEHYPVDATRVYCSGQSSGGMMSWACAALLPDLFAASAPVSAYNSPEPVGTSKVPVICYIGEAETTFRNGFTDKGGKPVIDTYTALYNTTEKWDTYTYMADDSKAPAAEGLFTKYVYSTDNVPMLVAVEVATKTHAIWPSECFDAYDNFLMNYTKDADGNLYYNGELVK